MTIELIVFTGLQAAGKTSFYRERFAATHAHVSKDLWPNARRREDRQRRLIEEHLRAGRSVVVDNTNPTPLEREPLIAIGRAVGVPVAIYVFVVTAKEALRRNAGREGRARVPDVAIRATARRLVPPRAEEGFERLYEVRLSEGGFVAVLIRAS